MPGEGLAQQQQQQPRRRRRRRRRLTLSERALLLAGLGMCHTNPKSRPRADTRKKENELRMQVDETKERERPGQNTTVHCETPSTCSEETLQ